MIRLVAVLALGAVAVLGAGCASSPASRFYTLSATASPSGTASSMSVVVGPVSVPPVVDRPQIVVNAGPNQVAIDEFNRWASPLQDNLSHVVADNLVAVLGTPNVTLFPQTNSADADYRASIEVQRFESVASEAAILDAVWTVRRTADEKSKTGRSTVREPVQDKGYPALVAAHSRAAARLSQDIADAVRTLGGELSAGPR